MLLFNFNIVHIKEIMLNFCRFFTLNEDVSNDLFVYNLLTYNYRTLLMALNLIGKKNKFRMDKQ